MSRIFDALKKAQSGRGAPHGPASVTPLSPPNTGASAPRGLARPGAPAARPLPLQMALVLDDEIVREMTTLRVSLEALLTDRQPRVIMFVSPQGREGTSTVALQFAQTMARDPQARTLVVDANVRRPIYEADPTRHVAVLDPKLRGRTLDPNVVTSNLDVLPAPDDLRRTGVFTPSAMRELLDDVGASYDWVVVDGPAVLDSPDASPLAATTDGVVLVVEAGRTKRPVLTRSADLLRQAGGRVLGSVLNRRRLEIPEFIYRRI